MSAGEELAIDKLLLRIRKMRTLKMVQYCSNDNVLGEKSRNEVSVKMGDSNCYVEETGGSRKMQVLVNSVTAQHGKAATTRQGYSLARSRCRFARAGVAGD